MLTNLADIEAVIFDMDGVLFLSSDCHARAFTETLAPLGITNFSYARVAGMRTDQVFRQLFAELNRPIKDDELNQLVADKQRRAREFLASEGKVADYSNELLVFLKQKYRLALASSASRPTVDIYLSKSAYPDVFEFCLDGSVVANAKPAPDIYHLSAQKLGVTHDVCVVIEDSLSGVKAAVAAAIPVIAVIGGEEPEPFLTSGASVVVSGLRDVAVLFEEAV